MMEEQFGNESPPEEATISVPTPKARRDNKLRSHHEDSDTDEFGVPWEHYLTHCPLYHRCPGCDGGKMRKPATYQ